MDSDGYYSYNYIRTHVELEDKNVKYKRNYFGLYK